METVEKKKRATPIRHEQLEVTGRSVHIFDDLLPGVLKREMGYLQREEVYSRLVQHAITTDVTYSKLKNKDVTERYGIEAHKVSTPDLKAFIGACMATPLNKIPRKDMSFMAIFMQQRMKSECELMGGLRLGEVMWWFSAILSRKLGGTMQFWWSIFYRHCQFTRTGKHTLSSVANRIADNSLETGHGFGIFGLKREGEIVHKPSFESQISTYVLIMESRKADLAFKKNNSLPNSGKK